ncbi:ComEC/Rec2 family competence protein [Tuwongella immobilis]|uniref:Metallo-beta-lactamase domain-containing protein n=1 Tax=Tuwongella immobilis TaxID=692036 RepID=A0A6C2YKE1_9BACT|nr:ComEC/Rec2 family competence protein [Tuwongella immobilis]VIP01896.1 Probable competence protein OS=Blastopirellula marina DSM 3645 GN=DSM3645_19957 PE=4 SV=1: DUF4131: Competence: Lactamase_B [Tuwongella immobilis]VTR99776.1 Probable competence protein OS=Blastopirellula marina DSM 3645 GN=DSM3645_19957 PE=4 SV=1: DUF4131: Competence: Lactamase_B [Tuwongella immobilis]
MADRMTLGNRYPAFAWENVVRAPLVPVALAATLGVACDRALTPGQTLWLSGLAIVIIALLIASFRRWRAGIPAIFWLWVFALGGLHHQMQQQLRSDSDLAVRLESGPMPIEARLRLSETPRISHPPEMPELIALPRTASTRVQASLLQIRVADGWQESHGRVNLTVYAAWDDCRVGDWVQVRGTLVGPQPPMNPGELDERSQARDFGTLGSLRVRELADVTRLGHTGGWGIKSLLDGVRERCRDLLQVILPSDVAPLAIALLLGDTSLVAPTQWEGYLRTGVIHVLAISGQHLAVLGWFLGIVLTACGMQPRGRALQIALILLAYAILTGGRPSSMRAALIVLTWAGGIWLIRDGLAVNSFAFAWLGVLILSPSDPFTAGCQLSFLAVAMLIGGLPRVLPNREPTAMEELLAEQRSGWETALRKLGDVIRVSYLANAVIFVGIAPIVANWTHLFSPISLLIGPILVLTTSISLIAGFLLLLSGGLIGPLNWLLSGVIWAGLRISDWIVGLGMRFPGGSWYVPSPPTLLVACSLVVVAVFLLWPATVRLRQLARRRILPVSITAATMLTLMALHRTTLSVDRDELRLTALSIGHGSATVLESSDGRVFLFDIGALRGPELTRYTVAPFLWQRGIARIDGVILSHADLDHFNGLLALLDRFSVGQIYLSPTFRQKQTPGVQRVLAELTNRGATLQWLASDEQIDWGGVQLLVRHPPAEGVPGDANANSLVLEVRHQKHRMLLTGDIHGVGLSRLLATPIAPVDVLMAPHHGSHTSNTAELLRWARPRFVISSQGSPRGNRIPGEVYLQAGIPYWRTDEHGAIEVRSMRNGLSVESFRQRVIQPVTPHTAR